MEHLDFVKRIGDNQVTKRIQVRDLPNIKKEIIIENGEVKWKDRCSEDPEKRLIREALDLDKWKYSWHIDIKPENYDQIQDIIQDKILARYKQIDFLLTVYFQMKQHGS